MVLSPNFAAIMMFGGATPIYVFIFICKIKLSKTHLAVSLKSVTSEFFPTLFSGSKIPSRVNANTTCSGSSVFLSLILVTKKHRYFPGVYDTVERNAAILPTSGLCLSRNSPI